MIKGHYDRGFVKGKTTTIKKFITIFTYDWYASKSTS